MTLRENPLDKLFRMEASRSAMVILNGAGVGFGIIIIYFILAQKLTFAPKLFAILSSLFILYFIVEYFIWKRNGIRAVEVDKNGLRIFRGDKMKVTSVGPGEIMEVDVFSKLNRRVVNILMDGAKKVEIIPGMITIFRGPRIRITNDAFNEDYFELFIALIKRMSD